MVVMGAAMTMTMTMRAGCGGRCEESQRGRQADRQIECQRVSQANRDSVWSMCRSVADQCVQASGLQK